MAKKKKDQSNIISNRHARHDYELSDAISVGIVLSGAETKNLRMGHGQLRGAYVTLKDSELWLINATIHGTNGIPIPENEQTNARKLLVKKREIKALANAKQDGRTIVPLEILTRGRFIKLRIAVGKGKKQYDKRQTLKAQDDKRRTQAVMKLSR
jgi:SsrA-binding protein